MTETATFVTEGGDRLPALTEDQMREVDRIAEEDFGLSVLQMMENAGRNLALHAIENLGEQKAEVAILAGSGGNGGGGICSARHLHNRGYSISLLLTKDADELRGSARHQLRILQQAGLKAAPNSEAETLIGGAGLTIDCLIGYSLKGAPRGRTADLIAQCNELANRVISLDLPSGVHATTGDTPGSAVSPHRTLTLALPKTGLAKVQGELYLADIGIPPEVYAPLGISFEPFFGGAYWVRIEAE